MQSGRDEFIQHFPVPRETLAKLDRYAELLAEWNGKFNLVSASTLPLIWQRHFLDSAQLVKHIPDRAETIADMGSGAGFPGMVLAILSPLEVHLIESTGKKAEFLRVVSAELGLNTVVRNERAESIRDFKPDVITARAMSALPELLKTARNLLKKHSVCLFLKGQKADEELKEAGKTWKFKVEKHTSLSDPSGSVLILKNVAAKRN
jgi:16S rRNA (guanine527-N7)-methyltransferase